MLTDEHLLAEHRECKRMPASYEKRKNSRKGLQNLPEAFTLGTGHVLFFVDKGMFTFKRYMELHHECLRREFNVADYSSNWEIYAGDLKDYLPTKVEQLLLVRRISQRIKESPKKHWHYYGKKLSKTAAIKLLKQTVADSVIDIQNQFYHGE